MSAAWLALVGERPADAFAAAEVREDGEVAGWLAVWSSEVRGALRADPAAFDPRGAPAAASLVMLDRRLPFDDTAVQEARRGVLGAAIPWAIVTTLVNDPVHFRGSLVARRGVDSATIRSRASGRHGGCWWVRGCWRPARPRCRRPWSSGTPVRPWPQSGFIN